MAETVFEIFNPVDGKTEGFRHTENVARLLIDRLEKYGHIRDFLPASQEGFYVVDMRDCVKSGPHPDKRTAQDKADFENMCSDVNAFRVVQHSF